MNRREMVLLAIGDAISAKKHLISRWDNDLYSIYGPEIAENRRQETGRELKKLYELRDEIKSGAQI